MRDKLINNQTGCKRIRQSFIIALSLFSFISFAGNDADLFKSFNPKHRIQTRGPVSFVADVDYIQAPVRKKIWLEKVFVEDQAGVLKSIKSDLNSWSKNEEYIRAWDLESFGSHTIVEMGTKKNYLSKRLLKYVDKRISGEVKTAKKGSTLAAVGKAQKALKPNTKVSISKNLKLKFKARVLQGQAIMKVVNPYVDYDTTFSVSDGVKMNVRKEIKSIRAVASVEYKPTEDTYTTAFDKKITNNLNLNISSSQDSDAAAFTADADSTFRLNYSIPYEF